MKLKDVMDEEVIAACEADGACAEGLHWLRAMARTYAELRRHRLEWYKWLAAHRVPPATLELLAKDSDVDVRWRVAGNPSTPPATLELLAKDSDVGVRRRVAGNPSTPPATEGRGQ
jgi:hypothetical protein